MNPEILVTGGSGILGAYVIRHLRALGYDRITGTYRSRLDDVPPSLRDAVTWVPLELPDKQAALEVMAGKQWVVHAAGLVSYLRRDRYRLLAINRQGTADLVDAALAHNIRHFVYVGSIAALGKDPDQRLLNEGTDWMENALSTPYGRSKYLGELEAWRGAAEGMPVSVVLPAIILGTGRPDRSSMKLLEQVIRNSGWAPGGESGFVDVRDVADFIGRLLKQEKSGERWVLSAGQMRCDDLFTRLSRLMGKEATFRIAPQWLVALVYSGLKGLGGAAISPQMVRQLYSHFSYDTAKSLGLDGFTYRPLESTLADLAAYLQAGQPAEGFPIRSAGR
jgi:nucleoside-diphosphate-sugar epimerase